MKNLSINLKNISLHLKAIEKLIEEGHAYYCHCSQERLDKLRNAQQKAGEKPKIRWQM